MTLIGLLVCVLGLVPIAFGWLAGLPYGVLYAIVGAVAGVLFDALVAIAFHASMRAIAGKSKADDHR